MSAPETRRIARVLALVAVLALPLAAGARAADVSRTRLAVAAFEETGPPGAEIPDVATLLADRIGALGVGRIVGPATLAATPNASPPDTEVVGLAATAEVDALVVGRTTRIGNQLSIDVHVRSGETGERYATFVTEVGNTAQLAEKVGELAGQVVEAVTAHVAAAAPPRVAKAQPSKPAPQSKRRPFDSGKPISIKSKTLEASEKDGRRRLIFTGNVRVTQDGVELTSNSLTADYPSGDSQPSLMVARGSVRVTQNGQTAVCDTGTYKRNQEMLVCCGNAELRDGPNRVRGKCIEFDLNGDTIRVEDATINIVPEAEPSPNEVADGDVGAPTEGQLP